MEPKVSPMNAALKWGALLGLINIVVTLINYSAGNMEPEKMNSGMTKLIQYGMYAVIILVLVIAMQQHRDKDLGGYMKYSRGLGLGTLIGVVYGVISAISIFIVFQFLMPPDFVDRLLEVTRENMLERNPNMTDDQMEMGLKMARKFITPAGAATFAFLGSVLMSFIFSLIISAFIKKNKPEESL
jgi:hypothetical protein